MSGRKVIVAEFGNELDAEIAKGHLEAAGIEASVVKDDGGGMFPSLQRTDGVQLLVDEEKQEEAQLTLQERNS
ncbi:MAG: DUF2007 domain-containing protein [bacterium]